MVSCPARPMHETRSICSQQVDELHVAMSSSAKVSVLRTVPTINYPEEPGAMSGKKVVHRARAAWDRCTKGTVFSSVFILLTTSVGAGTLSLPYGFARGGLLVSSVVLLLVVLVAIISGVYLFSSKRYCSEVFPDMEVWSYEDLAEASFGVLGRIAVMITLILLLFLGMIAYMIYARDQLDQIVQFALEKAHYVPSCSPLVNCGILMAMAFIPIFPVTLLRNLTPLQFTSTASILCIVYVAVVVVIKTGMAWADFNQNTTNSSVVPTDIPSDHRVQLWPEELTGLLTCISYSSLAFVCQFQLLPLQKELRGPQKTWTLYSIVIWATLLAYGLYNIVIFGGYFNFFSHLQPDIMLNYPHNDVLVTTARVALFLHLVLNYPVLLHPTRSSINLLLALLYNTLQSCLARNRQYRAESEPLLPKSSSHTEFKIPRLVWFCETWIIFGATFLPASFIPNVGYVWNFVGSTGGVLVFYVYPAAFYLRLRYLYYAHRARKNQVTWWFEYDRAIYKEVIASTILLVGVVLLGLANYQAVDAIVSSVHQFNPSSLCTQLKCSVMDNMTRY